MCPVPLIHDNSDERHILWNKNLQICNGHRESVQLDSCYVNSIRWGDNSYNFCFQPDEKLTSACRHILPTISIHTESWTWVNNGHQSSYCRVCCVGSWAHSTCLWSLARRPSRQAVCDWPLSSHCCKDKGGHFHRCYMYRADRIVLDLSWSLLPAAHLCGRGQ